MTLSDKQTDLVLATVFVLSLILAVFQLSQQIKVQNQVNAEWVQIQQQLDTLYETEQVHLVAGVK